MKKEKKNAKEPIFYLSLSSVVSSVENPDNSMHAIALQDNLVYVCVHVYVCVVSARYQDRENNKSCHVHIDVSY